MNAVFPILAAALLTAPAYASDIESGRQKAAVCIACHGDAHMAGFFYTLQLGGRRADVLAEKIYEYRGWKIFNPIMNIVTLSLTPSDIAEIAAYYQSLGKPAVTSPLFKVKGDEAMAAAPAVVASR